MGGGLLQLVAYGAQDVYLTGNPQITFFKVVYRRHTNFAVEAIAQTFSGTPGYGNTVTCQISRNGDLINRVYLQVTLPKLDGITHNPVISATAGPRYVNYIGLRLIKSVTIEIGGQQIDKHYSDWLYIWNELSLPLGKRYAYDTMVGADKDLTYLKNTNLYIPLEFWFCRNVGLALPLIALQYHEVKINIQFEQKEKCIVNLAESGNTDESVGVSTLVTSVPQLTDASLWVDYIFLDTDERRRFAQLSHEYLIEQLQFTGIETLNAPSASGGVTNNRIKLNFNHPCKELVWVAKPSNYVKKSTWYNYTNTDLFDTSVSLLTAGAVPYNYNANTANTSNTVFNTSNFMIGSRLLGYQSASSPLKDAILQLNGNDRFSVREATYFSYVQPYQHHTNIPSNTGIHVYSFALKPEDHQPSGTLNMSRIDTATLMVNVNYYTNNASAATTYEGIQIYAVNYNVLRILSGMGGLAYSN